MSGAVVTTDNIGPDTPLRLSEAARRAFPGGGVTASSLRRERDRGNLVVEVIAGKEFTTLRAIQEMRERCREPRKVQGSGLSRKNEMPTAGLSAAVHGSSETDRVKSAQAALQRTAKGLSKRSPSTSQANTKSRAIADVIPLKSSCSTC
jgi:hypothetical protein